MTIFSTPAGSSSPLRELLLLVVELAVEHRPGLLERVLDRLELVGEVFVGRADVEPVVLLDAVEIGLVDRRALGDLVRAAVRRLAVQQLGDPVERVGFDDAQLVVEVEAIALELVVDDLLCALVAHDAFAGEHLHVDDRAAGALVDTQRRVLHVGGLLAEDRAQQLFFRRQRGLALWRDLADERVARVHFRTDVDDARLVETSQLVLRQVRDVAGDFLGAELGVARVDHQLLDVDRGVAVFGDDAFADEDRVLEVVAVPGHERDQHVLAERQLADVGRGAVGNDVFGVDLVAALDDRALVDVRVLVRALVLDQVVDVDADFTRDRLLVVDADDDAVGVDVVHDAATLGGDDGARVLRGDAFHAGADQRLFGTQGSVRPGAACSRP